MTPELKAAIEKTERINAAFEQRGDQVRYVLDIVGMMT